MLKCHYQMKGIIVSELIAEPNLLNRMLEEQKSYKKISAFVSHNRGAKETKFSMNEDGFLYYKDRVCVSNDDELNKSILEEAHSGSI